MEPSGRTWAIVLAAGEGSRLQKLTTTSSGIAIPKQFCSLRGGPSLLHEALRRAARICDRETICTVVAEQQRQWWAPALSWLPRKNAIVQPRNRGTANGILLPLLHILERDPAARVVLLPSDHFVRDERTLAGSLELAVGHVTGDSSWPIFLGVEPDDADPSLGYIVPGRVVKGSVHAVRRFVEKPPLAEARSLIEEGALWNAFIIAARARTLLGLFHWRYPVIASEMRMAVACDAGNPDEPESTRRLYESLPEIDFSRHVAAGAESVLRVLAVPACGWSDLGTPARVARTLDRLPARTVPAAMRPAAVGAQLNLAVQYAQSTAA